MGTDIGPLTAALSTKTNGAFMSDATVLGLSAFDTTSAADEGAKMEVRSPATGEVMYWPDGRPWTITFLGADSPKVVDLARKQADRRSQAMMRNRQALSSATMEKDAIDLLTVATKEWDIPLGDGTPAVNSVGEYRAAYAKYRWLREQGDEFVGNRGNFMKA